MLQALIEIGKKLEKTWQRDSFPEIARTSLENFAIDSSLEEFELQVTDWLINKELPKQLNLYNNFGEPSLTLFNNGQFAIDIYFWRKNDTLIHSHAFRGAFKVLYGVSLHEEFEVETTETFSSDLLRTNVSQKNIRIMKPSDVQQINPDMELTHRVAHLDNPTVSLCIRSVEDVSLNQWHHLSTGLSYQKNHVPEKTIKQILYFQYLLGSDSARAQKFYLKLLSELNASSQISLYESLCFDELGLNLSTTEVAAELLQGQLQETKWFELYEGHYEKLQQNLQEYQVKSPSLKLLAHGINNGFTKKQIAELLEPFSDQKISNLCEELKKTAGVFTEGFKNLQLERIDKFLALSAPV